MSWYENKFWNIAVIWPAHVTQEVYEPVERFVKCVIEWTEPMLCFTDANGKRHLVSYAMQICIEEWKERP